MFFGDFMKKERIINNPNEMIELGKLLGKHLKENMVILLEGDLGAGKTTLTKGIAISLGINRVVNSPTFTILKIYEGRLNLYHMDVYRLDNNSGDEYLEEYFEAGGVCVIEWAHQVSDILPNEYLLINIKYLDGDRRNVEIVSNSSLYDELIEECGL